MNIEELWTSVKATLYERTVSPLASTFLLSWCAVNHEFFLISLSGEKVADKITLLDSEVFHYDLAGLANLVGLPLLSTAFLLFVLPLASRPVYRLWLEQQKSLEAIRDEKEGGRRLSVDQSRKIIADMAHQQQNHDSQVAGLRQQIDALLAESKLLQDKARGSAERPSDVPTQSVPGLPVQASTSPEGFIATPRGTGESNSDLRVEFDEASDIFFKELVPNIDARRLLFLIAEKGSVIDGEISWPGSSGELSVVLDRLNESGLVSYGKAGRLRAIDVTPLGRRVAQSLQPVSWAGTKL